MAMTRRVIEEMDITPDLAHHWLGRSTKKNRRLSALRVEGYATVMSRGEWEPDTGDPYRLDDDGNVRDGQHRLHAIVKSGVTLRGQVVIRGISDAAFDVLDRGAKRSMGDVLGIHGFASGKALGAAVKLLLFYDKFDSFLPKGRTSVTESSITPQATLKYIEEHPEVVQGLHWGDRIHAVKLAGGVGLLGACFTLFVRKDAEMAAKFAEHLITGESLTRGHPALLLRERLKGTDSMRGSALRDRATVAAFVVKAWNAYRKGQTLRVLSWRADGPSPEAFPKAI